MQTGDGPGGNFDHTAKDAEYDAIAKRFPRRIGATIAVAGLVAALGVGGIIKSNQESPFPLYESAKKTLTALTNYKLGFENLVNNPEATYLPEEILEGRLNSLTQYATTLDSIAASVREDIKTMEESPEITSYLARQNKINMAGSAAIVGALGIIVAGAKISDRKRKKVLEELKNKKIKQSEA